MHKNLSLTNLEYSYDKNETVEGGPLEHAASRAAIEAKSIQASRSLTLKSSFSSVTKRPRDNRANQFENLTSSTECAHPRALTIWPKFPVGNFSCQKDFLPVVANLQSHW